MYYEKKTLFAPHALPVKLYYNLTSQSRLEPTITSDTRFVYN